LRSITGGDHQPAQGHSFAGGWITLTIGKSGTTMVKHLKRPATACAMI